MQNGTSRLVFKKVIEEEAHASPARTNSLSDEEDWELDHD